MYIYSANSNYVENNYRDIYEGIKKKAGALLEYNSSVYDYEPWAGNFIYDYMYIVLAAIGIAAIAYQLTVYNRQRKNVYSILKGLGSRSDFFNNICPSGVPYCRNSVGSKFLFNR